MNRSRWLNVASLGVFEKNTKVSQEKGLIRSCRRAESCQAISLNSAVAFQRKTSDASYLYIFLSMTFSQMKKIKY